MATGVRILAPTIVRFTFKMSWNGVRTVNNVMDVSVEGGGVNTRDEAVDHVVGSMSGLWQERVIGFGPAGVTYQGAHWLDLDSLDGRSGDIGPAGGHPTVGSDASTMFPPNTAYLIHLNSTARRGQRQGRMYLAGAPEGSADNNGTLIPGIAASWDGHLNGLRTDIPALFDAEGGTAAWRTVHVTKPDKNDPDTWTWSSTTITSCATDPKVATQRRRLR